MLPNLPTLFRSLISSFYRNSSLAILVYAIDNEESFKNISSWLTELKKQASPEIKTILVGNKCDLESNREVTKDDAEKLRKEKNMDLFFETSAKTGYNAKNILVESAKMLFKEYLEYQKKHGKNAVYGNSAEANAKRMNLQSDDINRKNFCCSS